ncbi:MAG: hypothetical protein J7L86_01645 [Candidatus Marinimicrobia bacterium]|nr:hypothetical protein [Candidatus Neomarinimicrobiota bacterium]
MMGLDSVQISVIVVLAMGIILFQICSKRRNNVIGDIDMVCTYIVSSNEKLIDQNR